MPQARLGEQGRTRDYQVGDAYRLCKVTVVHRRTGTISREASPLRAEEVVYEERLGGLLKQFRRAG
jgi:hypothetical protein